ncbi:hypothetical protein C8R45DRAFT_826152, partial [Mycena sanguinolenta]
QAVENDPTVVVRSIETQMQRLMSEPCQNPENCDPVAILIDGLDECHGPGIQQEILHAIRTTSASQYPTSLRFIVASRPEPHIHEVFDSRLYFGNHRSINVEKSFEDVRRYLCDEFSRIHRDHSTMASIPSPWPVPHVLQNLVQKSSGYFVYASTIIKFIDDKNHRPTERLAAVRLFQDGNRMISESPFEALDQLYMAILCSAPRQSQLIPILSAISLVGRDARSIDLLSAFKMVKRA